MFYFLLSNVFEYVKIWINKIKFTYWIHLWNGTILGTAICSRWSRLQHIEEKNVPIYFLDSCPIVQVRDNVPSIGQKLICTSSNVRRIQFLMHVGKLK